VRALFQRIAHQPTIVKLRVMSRHQQLLRIDFEEPFATDALALARRSMSCSKASRCWCCPTTAKAR
jgi:bifunctional ADP-heptose synthase (sugar kinase/adenylyltransferase)